MLLRPCAYGIRLSLRQANCFRLCSTAPLMAAAEESDLPAVLAAIESQHVTHFAAAFRAACQVPKHWLGMQPDVDRALQRVSLWQAEAAMSRAWTESSLLGL